MKKLIIILSLLSIVLILLTFLNYEIDMLDRKIKVVRDENLKLEHDLNFYLAEWEYKTSPKNMEMLSKDFLSIEKADLIKLDSFLYLLNNLETDK